MKDFESQSSNRIVQRIFDLCEQRGWSINCLATQAGVAQSTLSALKSKGNTPSVPTLERLCAAFGISMAEFFAYDGNTVVVTDEQRQLLDAWSAAPQAKKDVIWDILGKL